MFKIKPLPQPAVVWLQAIFNPLAWMMTLWYVAFRLFFQSLPMFALHDFQHTMCQPFVTSIDNAYKIVGTAVCYIYPLIGIVYFFHYCKINKLQCFFGAFIR